MLRNQVISEWDGLKVKIKNYQQKKQNLINKLDKYLQEIKK